MTPDVNILLAASRKDHPHHVPALAWLEQAIADGADLLVIGRPITGAPDVAAAAAAIAASLA